MNAAPHRVAILVYDGVTLLDVGGSRGGVQGGEPVRCRLPDPATVADRYGRHVEPRDPDRGRRRRLLRARFQHIAGGRVRHLSALPCPRRPGGRCADTGGWARPGRVDMHRGVRPRRRRPADGKRATTHWQVARELAAPVSDVPRRARRDLRSRWHHVHVGRGDGRDRSGACSRRRGPRADLARNVARALVVYMQRAGGQSQFSAPLQGPPPRSPGLSRKITDLVTANPRGDHSLGELAKHLQREHPATHPAFPRRAVDDTGPLCGKHPIRDGQGTARPRTHRNAGRDPRRVPQLRKHATGFRQKAVDQPRCLPAPVQHGPPHQRGLEPAG